MFKRIKKLLGHLRHDRKLDQFTPCLYETLMGGGPSCPNPGPWVKCLSCGAIIRSEYRYDLRECSCGKIFVDGGGDYLRMGCSDPDKSLEDCIEVLKFSCEACRTQGELRIDMFEQAAGVYCDEHWNIVAHELVEYENREQERFRRENPPYDDIEHDMNREAPPEDDEE